jgi:hypothetical protein
MAFDATAPWWWFGLTIPLAIVFAILAWRDTDRRYPDSAFKRAFFRGFGTLIAVAFPVFVFLRNSAAIRVRDDAVQARPSFQLAFRSYSASDIAGYGFERVGSAPGTRGKGRSTVMAVHFRDGTTVNIAEKSNNYDRLKLWLDSQGVQQR